VQSLTQPAHGTAAINGDGTVRYTPALGFFGTDTFTYTATDGITADTAAVTIGVTGVRYISTRNGGTVFSANGNRRTFTDADILRVEIAPDGRYTYALYFDGSDAGLTTAGEDIDAFAFLPDGSIIVSTAGRYKVTGTGGSLTGGGEDLLQFTPTQFGTTTVGTWTRYFDGSDVGLKGRAENVDAVAVLPDGRLLLSVAKNATVTGNITALGQDLMAFTPTVLGDTTAGTFAPYFQGNQVGLDDPKGENITAIFADTTGEGDPILFMSTAGNFNVQGLAGSADDVFAFYPTSLGPTTDGTFDTGLALDGDELGLAGFGVDGVAFGVSL
jgi:hypothetical protein